MGTSCPDAAAFLYVDGVIYGLRCECRSTVLDYVVYLGSMQTNKN